MAALSGIICLLFIPRLDQDCIEQEDLKFRHYLEEQGFDVSKMGLPITQIMHGMENVEAVVGSGVSGISDGSAAAREGGASELSFVNSARKWKGWFKRFLGVAT